MANPTQSFLMRNPDELSLTERRALRGQWIALERYTPQNLALRRITALSSSPAECRRQLEESGKDPALYELVLLR
jgi:hypothetical protein